MALARAVAMLPVCASLPPNAHPQEDSTSATPVPVRPKISSAAPKPHVAVVATAAGHRSATVKHCPINAQVRRISNAVHLSLLAEAEAAAEAEVLEITPLRHFHWSERARREQSTARGRSSRGTRVLSARFTASGIASVPPKTAIIAAVWPPI